MTTTKHTPGPWKAMWIESNKRTHAGHWVIFSGNEIVIGQGYGRLNSPKSESNAQAISALPDLIESLEDIARRADILAAEVPNGAPFRFLANKARAAIAKAGGRQGD